VLIELTLAFGVIVAIDGDTLLTGSERVRIQGVDTPEMTCACPEECRAAWAAKRFTQSALDGGAVSIERNGTDRYGRTLARVLVNGKDLAKTIIEAGHGRPYDGKGKRGSWCGVSSPQPVSR
jgi:endonuclease YncB( thermonuclease family)